MSGIEVCELRCGPSQGRLETLQGPLKGLVPLGARLDPLSVEGDGLLEVAHGRLRLPHEV